MFLACACLPALTVLLCHACRPCGLVPAVGIVLPLRVQAGGTCAYASLGLVPWQAWPSGGLCHPYHCARACAALGPCGPLGCCYCLSGVFAGRPGPQVVLPFLWSAAVLAPFSSLSCRLALWVACAALGVTSLLSLTSWPGGLGALAWAWVSGPLGISLSLSLPFFCERLNAPGGLEAPLLLLCLTHCLAVLGLRLGLPLTDFCALSPFARLEAAVGTTLSSAGLEPQ